ncbi:PREDICTED: F-box protein At3g07870-like [Ipomoea nil]|uniref:F-box protein At3g07870-like n=1 Tax=Ipomoea nil TaxID=35883 RepID=UPI0009015C4A|nr:PREDICTED: F-box protein At3g07870-like [Ipomoea nil]
MSDHQTPSSSPACLLLYHEHLASNWNKSVNTLKFVNLDDHPDRHAFHHHPQNDLHLQPAFPEPELCVVGSAKGLVCLNSFSRSDLDSVYICNPTTREYVKLPKAHGERVYPNLVAYGFGVTPLTNTFKVVRIYQEQILDDHNPSSYYKSDLQVYTLGGAGSWRSAGSINCGFGCREFGQSLDGKLHWLVGDANGDELICSFDLESETIQTFPSAPPTPVVPETDWIRRSIGVLGNCLCLCDNTAHTSLDIWVMKEYGNGDSWTKEMSIASEEWMLYEMIHLVKGFKDGEILFLFWDDILFSYHPERKSVRRVDVCEAYFSATVHVPSSISLESIFGAQQVKHINLS